LSQIGVPRWLQGRAAELLAVLPAVDPERTALDDALSISAQRAVFAAEVGDAPQARAALTEVVWRLENQEHFAVVRSVVLVASARAARLVGPGPWLDPLRAALEPLAGRFGVVNPGASSLGAIDVARGGLALATGDLDTAIEQLSSAPSGVCDRGLGPSTAEYFGAGDMPHPRQARLCRRVRRG
jgi:hypothetical protein